MLPLTPSADRMPAAVLRLVVAVDAVLDDVLEDLLDLPVDDAAEALVEVLEEAGAVAAGVGGVGLKVVCPTPNPSTAPSVPVPPTVT